MSQNDDTPTGGPEGAAGYEGPGYPTVSDRRKHLKRLALAAGAAAVGGGLFVAGKELVKPQRGGHGNQGWIGTAQSWLSGLTEEPPPRLAGAPPPPPLEDPRVRGDMVVPSHQDPSTCQVPKPPAVDDHPPLPGEMAVPDHVEPAPDHLEPAPPPEPADYPRVKGKVAAPRPRVPVEEYPDAAGGLSMPDMPEPPIEPVIQPPPEVTATVTTPETPTPPEPPPSGTVEGALRSLYLTGATSSGTPFTVLVRVDPDDEASYEAVKAARKAILTALSPLVGTPALAEDQAASKLVTRLVPGATVRFAGVVR